MKFYQKLDGGVHVSAREYDIATDTAIMEGQVVKLAEGRVVSAAANETGAVLGVAAESHSGVADALDKRANGDKIFVIDDPDAVFQIAPPKVYAATACTSTTLVCGDGFATFANDDFNGGYVKCVSKAAGSANTDKLGTMRRITDFAASSKTFTLTEGGAPEAGDCYEVYPPVGFAKGSLDTDKTGLTLGATADLPIRVIGRDSLGKVMLQIKKHLFAVDA